jgi:hypothetical protein
VYSSSSTFVFNDPTVTAVEPTLLRSTSGLKLGERASQTITLKGRNFGSVEASEGCLVSLNFFDRRPLIVTSATVFHSDSAIIFEIFDLPVGSDTVWAQLDICGALSNRHLLNVSRHLDPYEICVASKPTFDRRNDDCMHCCRRHCQTLDPHAMAGVCKQVCLSKCAVSSAYPPDILQLRVLPGHYGDCAVFVWELALETALSDTIEAIEIEFKSSNSSEPHKLMSRAKETRLTSCGFMVGTRIFETKARVIGRMIDTQWFAFASQFLFSIVTSPSLVQNISLVFNNIAAHKKVQLIVSWTPPLYHGGSAISSYRVQVLLANGSALSVTQSECSTCTALWLLDEIDGGDGCSVEVAAFNSHGKQSAGSARCSSAAHTEDAVAPIIALSPGSAHAASLVDMVALPGLWSAAQGFSVFDPIHPCESLHVSYRTDGRFENIQEIRIASVEQQDTAWCSYEISVLASQHGDCSDILVHCLCALLLVAGNSHTAQVTILVVNLDGVSSKSSARVQILASWHAIEPTVFLANGGASVTVAGTCLPAAAVAVEFSGTLANHDRCELL